MMENTRTTKMRNSIYITTALPLLLAFCAAPAAASTSTPSVVIDVIVKNSNVDLLSYHLFYIQQLDYPKDKLSVWIHGGFDPAAGTSSQTATALAWKREMKHEYRDLKVKWNCHEPVDQDQQGLDAGAAGAGAARAADADGAGGAGDTGAAGASGAASAAGAAGDKYKVTELRAWQSRQNSLQAARKQKFDYIFLLDADAILEDPTVLKELIAEKQPMIAPMLKDTDDMWFQLGNFQADDDDMTTYVLNQTSTGRFDVKVARGAVLVALNDQTKLLQFESNVNNVYRTPEANVGVKLQVLNTRLFGWLPCDHIRGVGTSFPHIIFDKPHLERLPYANTTYPAVDNAGFDAVYVINLARRSDRKERMEVILRGLGIKARFTKAVDGWTLTEEYLRDIGVATLPGYMDPFNIRPMKMGEIGCFLSHYNIWKEAERNDYKNVLILEDDARFRPHFKMRARQGLREANQLEPMWDLLFLSRKPVAPRQDSDTDSVQGQRNVFNEFYVPGSDLLVYPTYSYYGLAYALSRAGVKKLLWGEPLKKMIPVDELIPILYGDSGLDSDIVGQYSEHPRLNALAIHPQIIQPLHYIGDTEYVSDTEIKYDSKPKDFIVTRDEL